MNKIEVSGVGVNLRLEIIDQILAEQPKLDCLEIITENWFSKGPHHKKLEKLRADYPISFHCVGMNLCGEDELNLTHIKRIKELADIYQPLQISDHLCMTAHGGIQHHDLLPIPYTNDFLENTASRVNKIQEVLQLQLLVENLSYYIEYQSSSMSEFDFLTELACKTDCQFLLDLNNIWVNSKNFETNIDIELTKLDWIRVKEVHLAGPEIQHGIYVDTHGSAVHDDVLNLLYHHKSKLKQIPIILERDNNLLNLKEIMSEIESIKRILN